MSSTEIGARLRQVRGQLSQREFAERLNTSSGRISELEGGKTTPGGDFLVRLNQEFQTDVTWLLTGEHLTGDRKLQGDQLQNIEKQRVARGAAELPELIGAIARLADDERAVKNGAPAKQPTALDGRESTLIESFRAIPEEGKVAVENTCFAIAAAHANQLTPGTKYRPKPAGPDQPSVHEPTATYSKKAKKPQEAA